MGLDPEDDTYEAGDECALCVDVLFGGVTPKTVIAIVQDVILCPLKPPPGPAPNGTFYLNQGLDPCFWSLLADNLYTYTWRLFADRSVFTIDMPHVIVFVGTNVEICIDSFSNQTDCLALFDFASGGSVQLFWGPDIPPPC